MSQLIEILFSECFSNKTIKEMFDCSKGAAHRRALKRRDIVSLDIRNDGIKRYCSSLALNMHASIAPSLQQKIFHLCAAAKRNIFDTFIRCDSSGIARCQWEISKAKRLESVHWLSPTFAKGFKKLEIPMPNPDNIISASPAPQKRCPSVIKKKLQGIPWHKAFIRGELAFAPITLAHEESTNYAIAVAAGIAGTKPVISFISIPFSEYTEDMAHALKLGFSFIIVDGRLQLLEEKIIVSKLQYAKIAKAYSEAGLQDFEALHALQYGAKSFSKAPKICSFAAPHTSVFMHAVALRKKLYEEVDNRWLLPAHFPCTIPTCSLRLKVVEKSGGGIRLLVDSSYPWLEIEGSAVEDGHGLIKPVAPYSRN